MEQNEKLLRDYSDIEKGSYLGAIASIATADRTASEEELEYIQTLADSAELSPEQKEGAAGLPLILLISILAIRCPRSGREGSFPRGRCL